MRRTARGDAKEAGVCRKQIGHLSSGVNGKRMNAVRYPIVHGMIHEPVTRQRKVSSEA